MIPKNLFVIRELTNVRPEVAKAACTRVFKMGSKAVPLLLQAERRGLFAPDSSSVTEFIWRLGPKVYPSFP